MTADSAMLERIRAALYPCDLIPDCRPWNLDELEGLLPAETALRPAAVLVGLVPRSTGWTVLLTLRHAGLRHHAGQVSFPGGRIEADDAGPAQAALREAQEEVALPPAQAEPLGWLDPLATITGFRVLPLVARLHPDIAPVADPREVAEVFEVPLDYLLDPANLQRLAVDYRGRTRYVLEYQPHVEGARIWGATASILHNLIDRLGRIPA